MRAKKILSVLSAAALAAALCTMPAQAARFTDTVGHPASAAIDQFARLKIVEGVGGGRFSPDRSINRAEMCAILDRIFTYGETAENTFPDLDEGAWYAGYMLRANAAGVILGDPVGIRPRDTIRWDEALVMIGRAFGLEERPEVELPVPVKSWARGYIGTMWEEGYFSELDPGADFTRADAVTVLDKVVSDVGWSAAGKVVFMDRLVPILEDVPAPGYDASAFYREDGRLYYDDGATPVAYGVDVSSHQGEIDWQAVAADGIQFAMIRLGYRGYGSSGSMNLDRYFEQNLAGALEAGLDVGVYFFSQAITPEEALEEALFVLDHLEGRELTYPVVFDWENIDGGVTARTDGLDDAVLDACAAVFFETIAEAGYQPMAYFNGYLGMLHYDLSAMADYPFWYAYYTKGTVPTLPYDFRMWQYSSTGSVAGIEGNADMDICLRPYGKAWDPDAEPVPDPDGEQAPDTDPDADGEPDLDPGAEEDIGAGTDAGAEG